MSSPQRCDKKRCTGSDEDRFYIILTNKILGGFGSSLSEKVHCEASHDEPADG